MKKKKEDNIIFCMSSRKDSPPTHDLPPPDYQYQPSAPKIQRVPWRPLERTLVWVILICWLLLIGALLSLLLFSTDSFGKLLFW